MPNAPRHLDKERKRADHEQRKAQHDKLTTKQKIEKAAGRRGLSQRELGKLTKQLAAEKAAKQKGG